MEYKIKSKEQEYMNLIKQINESESGSGKGCQDMP